MHALYVLTCSTTRHHSTRCRMSTTTCSRSYHINRRQSFFENTHKHNGSQRSCSFFPQSSRRWTTTWSQSRHCHRCSCYRPHNSWMLHRLAGQEAPSCCPRQTTSTARVRRMGSAPGRTTIPTSRNGISATKPRLLPGQSAKRDESTTLVPQPRLGPRKWKNRGRS